MNDRIVASWATVLALGWLKFSQLNMKRAHAHRFRHTLATGILARGGTMADVADVLGISEHIAPRHYARWSAARQERIATIMRAVQGGAMEPAARPEKAAIIQ